MAPLARPSRSAPLLVGLLMPLAIACSGASGESESSGSDSADTADTADTDSGGDSMILVGTFKVELVAPVAATNETPMVAGQTTVLGKVYDGPSPASIVWELAAEAGECALKTPRVPYCETPCGGSAACVEDDTCEDYPLAHSAGVVTLSGVAVEGGGDSIELKPVNNTYQPVGTKLAYPAFAAGDTLHLAAAGDFYSGFTVDARGIAPLEMAEDPIPLGADLPAMIAWTPAADPSQSAIHVKVDISHHGGTKGMIECDAADDGSLEIPAALVSQLLDLGVAGYPSLVVSRSAVGSRTIAQGRVDLVITASLERTIAIDGLVSCTDDSQCSGGQTCQSDLTCK